MTASEFDAHLVHLAAELTANNPLPPPRVVERFGSPEEQVLQVLRNTALAAGSSSEEEVLLNCRQAGLARAAQLSSLYDVWHHGVGRD